MANESNFKAVVINYFNSLALGGERDLSKIPLKEGDQVKISENPRSFQISAPWRRSETPYVKYGVTISRQGRSLSTYLSIGQICRFAILELWEDRDVLAAREGYNGRQNALFDENLLPRSGEEVYNNLLKGITLQKIFPSKDGKKKAYRWII